MEKIKKLEKDRMMEWVKCSDRMPEEEVEVLIYREYQNNKGIDIDKISIPKDGNLWSCTSKELVKAWMPLPEPPKKKHCCTCHVTNETCQEKDGKLYLVDRDGTFARYHINYCPFCGEKA